MSKVKKTTVVEGKESREVDLCYYIEKEVKEVQLGGDKMVLKFYDRKDDDGNKIKDDDIEMHADFFERVLSDEPTTDYAIQSAKAATLAKHIINKMREYKYPIDDMKYVIDSLNRTFTEEQQKAYEKVYGVKPGKLTVNKIEEILAE